MILRNEETINCMMLCNKQTVNCMILRGKISIALDYKQCDNCIKLH